MMWGGRHLSDAEMDELYTNLFVRTATGPVVLAHLVHEECHLWDEVDADPQLVAQQNIARRLLKRVGMIREDNVFELTRRLLEVPPPANLREG